jgi:Ca2+:H+ antiporter
VTTSTAAPPTFVRSDYVVVGGGSVAVVLAGVAHYVDWGTVLPFLFSALAVTLLASLVGRSVEQLGDRFGPGATGVLQSALGNLPELFISLFALKAGLIDLVKAALIGSILANLLLVLGMAFVVGGLRHGPQHIDSARARTIASLMILSVGALVLPSVAHYVDAPAASHEKTLSLIASVVLIAIFLCSLPGSLRKGQASAGPEIEHEPPRWPVPLAVGLLALTSLLAAFVSDWFVAALEPAMHSLNISQAFAGLVIVAIAGNAVENVVGIQLAARNRMDYALSVILQSPVQIALVLAPVLVLGAPLVGATFTLVLSPILIAVLVLSVLVTTVVVFDAESNWLEGVALIVLYCLCATAFFWG